MTHIDSLSTLSSKKYLYIFSPSRVYLSEKDIYHHYNFRQLHNLKRWQAVCKTSKVNLHHTFRQLYAEPNINKLHWWIHWRLRQSPWQGRYRIFHHWFGTSYIHYCILDNEESSNLDCEKKKKMVYSLQYRVCTACYLGRQHRQQTQHIFNFCPDQMATAHLVTICYVWHCALLWCVRLYGCFILSDVWALKEGHQQHIWYMYNA